MLHFKRARAQFCGCWLNPPSFSLRAAQSSLLSACKVKMKSLVKSNPTHNNIYRVLYYSTQSLSSLFASSPTPTLPLNVRISRAGHPKTSVLPLLEEWIQQGNNPTTYHLQTIIRQLRKHNRYAHALQISEWISDRRSLDFKTADVAIHLDLISKVYGLEAAENYFNKIPEASRNYQIYGALLNCYASRKKLGEAETIMEKMRDLGFLKNSLSYNVLLNLYSELGEEEKMVGLLKDMQRQDISFDKFTFSIQLKCYALTGNIKEIDKLLTKMESDPRIRMSWNSYVTAVNGYLKGESAEKAVAALKKAEILVSNNQRKPAYEILITQYAAAGSKDDVHRIWNLYKNTGKTFNSGYLCMLSSMAKFDDIDEVERIWKEGESSENVFDLRIPNLMITIYCKMGLLDKAELCVNKIVEKGKEPNATTWDRLVDGYVRVGQMFKAIEVIKKALSASKPYKNWKTEVNNSAACIKYLKSQGDEVAAEELLKTVTECCNFSRGEYKMLMDCVNNEE